MKKLIGLILVGFALVFCATSCSANTTAEVVKKEVVVSTTQIQTEATEIAFVGQAVIYDCLLYQVYKSQPIEEIYSIATKKPVVPTKIGDNLIRQGKQLPKRQSINYRT